MSDERRALGHLLLGIEELLRAGAEAAAALRAQSGAAPRGQEGERGSAPLLDSVRAALEREVTRWELRGDDDPAARRVRDLFEAILDLIGSPSESPRSEAVSRPGSEDRARSAPSPSRRSAVRGVRH